MLSLKEIDIQYLTGLSRLDLYRHLIPHQCFHEYSIDANVDDSSCSQLNATYGCTSDKLIGLDRVELSFELPLARIVGKYSGNLLVCMMLTLFTKA